MQYPVGLGVYLEQERIYSMSDFQPYHESLPQFLRLLDPYDDHYLIRIGVLADLACTTKVPKEHRVAVSNAFAKHALDIRYCNHWPEDEARSAIALCESVRIVMIEQDAKDSAKERREQQQ
jgi:hypothetical protein